MNSRRAQDHFLAEYDVRAGEAIQIDHSLEGHAPGIWPRNNTEKVVKWVYEEALEYQIGEIDNKRDECLDHATRKMPDNAIETIRHQLKKENESNKKVGTRPEAILEQDGIPDFLVFDEDEGNFYFLEVKAHGDRLRDSQQKWITEFDYLPVKIALSFPEGRLRQEFLNRPPEDYFQEII
jgi:hypothetical protein